VLAGLAAVVDGLETCDGVIEGVFSTATLGGWIDAEVGRLERGKYLSSKSALSDHSLLGCRVVELPALVAMRVTYKDALLHMRSKTGSLVLLYVHIGSTAPDSKVGHIRLPPIPQFIGSSTLDSICRASVLHMD
jgi:hypothetical protein